MPGGGVTAAVSRRFCALANASEMRKNHELALWASRRRLFKPARMPKSDAPTDARVKWGRMLLDAREARKCYKMLEKFSPFFIPPPPREFALDPTSWWQTLGPPYQALGPPFFSSFSALFGILDPADSD